MTWTQFSAGAAAMKFISLPDINTLQSGWDSPSMFLALECNVPGPRDSAGFLPQKRRIPASSPPCRSDIQNVTHWNQDTQFLRCTWINWSKIQLAPRCFQLMHRYLVIRGKESHTLQEYAEAASQSPVLIVCDNRDWMRPTQRPGLL